MRAVVAAIAAISCAAAAGSLGRHPRPRLLWNASPSSPPGLYWVGAPARLRRGDMAVAWPPEAAWRLAARRHYLPARVPLVKRIAAVSGDEVCAAGRGMSINGRPAAQRRTFDRRGRRMPSWGGCRLLGKGQVLLLGTAGPDSFDGRYFGVSERSALLGRARLLWPR